MASDFHARGDISMCDLFKEIGCDVESITWSLVEECLEENPHLVESWLTESADTRSASGWYLKSPADNDSKKWTVGYYPDGEKRDFDTGSKACAFFLTHYIKRLNS